jgi:hypothetical protein
MATPPPQAVFEISTTSTDMPNPNQLPPPQLPTITVNGQPFGQLPTPGTPNGWQVLVLDPSGDLTNPSSIVTNVTIGLQADGTSWMSTYEWMYSSMVKTVLTAGNVEQQIVFAVSYGLDAGMAPSNDGLELLLQLGAGPQLQGWETTADVGSQSSEWVGYPTSYILVGGSNYGYGQGYEAFATTGGDPAPATLSVTLDNAFAPLTA